MIRALRWTIQIASLGFLTLVPDLHHLTALADEETTRPGDDFFHACSGGDADAVSKSLEAHPDWVNAYTSNGETCLHLTGIYGKSSVTELLLEKGADPNVRSTYEQGLRMHPLSWNVYGGHLDNIVLLLDAGADVNLDFDSMRGEGIAVTPLDVLLELLQNEKGDERFVAIEKVFSEHGAKTMDQLRKERQQEERGGTTEEL